MRRAAFARLDPRRTLCACPCRSPDQRSARRPRATRHCPSARTFARAPSCSLRAARPKSASARPLCRHCRGRAAAWQAAGPLRNCGVNAPAPHRSRPVPRSTRARQRRAQDPPPALESAGLIAERSRYRASNQPGFPRVPCGRGALVRTLRGTAPSSAPSAPQTLRVLVARGASIDAAGRLGLRGFRAGGRGDLIPTPNGGGHETLEQRVSDHRPALEFRMELATDEIRMLRKLDDLHQAIIRASAAQHQARARELLAILVVELEAVTMAFGDLLVLVQLERVAAGLERARISTEAHRAALVLDATLIGHQVDDRIGALFLELGRAHAFQPAHVARERDHRQLHAQTDAEKRHTLFARVADGRDLPFHTAVAEAAGHQNGIQAAEQSGGTAALDLLRVDVLELNGDIVGKSSCDERLVQRLVAVFEVNVLADHADAHRAFGRLLELLDDSNPVAQVRLTRPDVEALRDLIVQALSVQHERQLIDARHVYCGDHAVDRDVGEQRDLFLQALSERTIAATVQDVRLNADLAHLAH